MQILPVPCDEALFAALTAEAEAEGYLFLRRHAEEWRDGTLRFDRPGEIFLGALDGGRLVGVAGISLDPYHPEPGLGRVRHLYVAPDRRRDGIGSALVTRLLDHGRGRFDRLRLWTRSASSFYERLGFTASPGPKQTHVIALA